MIDPIKWYKYQMKLFVKQKKKKKKTIIYKKKKKNK